MEKQRLKKQTKPNQQPVRSATHNVYANANANVCIVSDNAAMSLAILPWLHCSDLLINQGSHSKNGLRPQLIRYDASVGTDAPNQSLTLRVNGPLTSMLTLM